jgi:hypothetical protein
MDNSNSKYFFNPRTMRLLLITKQQLFTLNSFLLLLSVSIFSCNQNKTSGNEKPEDNRFTRVVFARGFNEAFF